MPTTLGRIRRGSISSWRSGWRLKVRSSAWAWRPSGRMPARPIRPEEQRPYSTVMRRAFGASFPTDEELEVSKGITEFDRTLAFFDGPEIVATAGIFSYEMTVPGGVLPCAGVTRVGVLSTHR